MALQPDYLISRYCFIRDRRIVLNSKQMAVAAEGTDISSFIHSVYKTFGFEYPKFYKMDLLCKLGVLTSDFLLDSGKLLAEYREDEVAIVLSNANSSLETDYRYYESIADKANYYPNPALFVYTLPNIVIGEISIRFGIKGESIFFVSRRADLKNLFTYSLNLLRTTGTKAVITGVVDLDVCHCCESVLYFVEEKDCRSQATGFRPFSLESMEDLFFEKNLSLFTGAQPKGVVFQEPHESIH